MFLARKELWFSKKRFFLIGFIIVLITWLVFVLSGLGNGLSDLGTAVIRYSDLDVAIFEKDSELTLGKSTLPESVVAEALEVEGVEEAASIATAAGAIYRGVNVDEETGKKTAVLFVGIEPGSFMEPKTISGENLDEAEPNRVLVDESLMREGFKLNDKITLNGVGTEYTIGGFVSNKTLNHMPAIFVTMDTLRGFKYMVPGSDMGIEKPISAVFLKGNNIDTEELTAAIDGIETGSIKETLNGIPGYSAESGTINLMLWLLIFISAFVIAVFFYVLTTQKVNQFGVMKAIGASNGFIIKSVVSEVFLLSGISILIGVGLTYLMTLVLPEDMPFTLLPNMVMLYGVILLATSLIGSLFSIRSIIKIDPITALGRVE
ncbi:ABC transporter permease [Jeotgalibaca porci]|uniref:Putative hemin transport system permease protein HrtB n=3 Tax=Jeotgalibaca porci TaxID=1868793 RepID=A0A6G7WHY4_9LACT|nr:ABC transporter permease [Jeotgalibaca porci]QIK51875.1 ABC transporter permease [Jeotgalibaca porci]